MPIYNLRWKGMLTQGNIGEVAKLFRLLLNRKRFAYTFVRPTIVQIDKDPQVIDTRVDVHTRQRLLSPVRVTDNMISIPTTEYLCMFQTNLPAGEHAQYDYTHKNPYVAFSGESVVVRWQTPCGDQAVDVFTLEVR